MNFVAKCEAVVSKNGSAYVLLKFAGHLMGELPKALGQLTFGKIYRITIE
jgi:hypothetical protein